MVGSLSNVGLSTMLHVLVLSPLGILAQNALALDSSMLRGINIILLEVR